MPRFAVVVVLALLAAIGAEALPCESCLRTQGEHLLIQVPAALRVGGNCKVWRDFSALKALASGDPELWGIEREVAARWAAFCKATEARPPPPLSGRAAGENLHWDGSVALLVEAEPLSGALQAMWDDMDGVKRDAESATALAESLLTAAVANISACAGMLNATMQGQLGLLEAAAEAGRDSHTTCRSAEAELKLAMDNEYHDFHAYWTALSLPECAGSFPHTKWDDAWACLRGLDAWTAEARANVSARHDSWMAAREARGNKTHECNAKQSGFEAAVCDWIAEYKAACSTYAACYASTVAAHGQVHADTQQVEMARKADYASAERVQCHLRVMNASDPAEKGRLLAECAAAQQPDTGHLSVTYPAVPGEQACGAAKEPRPCEPGWLRAAYEGQPWNAEAPAQACTPCEAPTPVPTPAPPRPAFAWAGREFQNSLSDFENFTSQESGTDFGPELSVGFTARIDKANDWSVLDLSGAPDAMGSRLRLWIGCGYHGQDDLHVTCSSTSVSGSRLIAAGLVNVGSTSKFLVTLAGDGQVKVFKDGQLVQSGDAPAWASLPGPFKPAMLWVGKHAYSTSGAHPMGGLIQDFSIWNRVLTWQEFEAWA